MKHKFSVVRLLLDMVYAWQYYNKTKYFMFWIDINILPSAAMTLRNVNIYDFLSRTTPVNNEGFLCPPSGPPAAGRPRLPHPGGDLRLAGGEYRLPGQLAV